MVVGGLPRDLIQLASTLKRQGVPRGVAARGDGVNDLLHKNRRRRTSVSSQATFMPQGTQDEAHGTHTGIALLRCQASRELRLRQFIMCGGGVG